MGKGYNNYMCKKPFHPGSKANIKRAWMAEQKTENEKKKQEELKVQYDKEQELYNNRALLSTESKDKLELNFMYQAPPGAKRERQKEDDEPEFKFEWQRKYNAPREDYAKGNADIKDQPFGIPVRNVRCIKCHKWGHINTDKECPLFSQASTSSMPTTSMDPMELMKQMREDGYGLKENVLGHHLNPAAANQQLIPSDESDPEMEFLKSLSASDKKKLLRKLKKLSKKQEKASHCKKKKSKKSGKSKSKDKSSDHKKKKTKKSKEFESSDESDSESSSEDSAEEKQKKRKHSKKDSSSKKSKERHYPESSDSELDESNKSKFMKQINQREKEISRTEDVKTDATSSKKVRSVSSDSEHESKKSKYKNSKHSNSKNVVKEKYNNSSESDSDFEDDKKRKVNHLKDEKNRESTKRTKDILSEREKNIKMSSKYSIDKNSRSCDIINEDHKKSRNKNDLGRTLKNFKPYHKGRSSSESQDEKKSHRYNFSKKDNENEIKHRIDSFKKDNGTDTKSQASENYKDDAKLSKNERRTKEHRSNEKVENLVQENLHIESSSKKRSDKEHTESKLKKKKDDLKYKQKAKDENKEVDIKIEIKKKSNDSNNNDLSSEELPKRTTDESETPERKKRKIDLDAVEPKRNHCEEPSVSHFKKEKDSSFLDKEQKLHKMAKEPDLFNFTKKRDESKMSEKLNSQKKRNTENKELHLKGDSDSENVSKIHKCSLPLHPDGFSHFCPQARIEANYVQADEEYQGKEHDDFRYLNRGRRSPSVKQKYNN